jgi:hypothetical protein
MYTSIIGKSYLELYNKDKKKELSAKDYFSKVLFPLFYDNSKYLQSPANTPFFQVIAQKKTKDAKARVKAYLEVEEKIRVYESNPGNGPDMSFALGFASADLSGTTSGQVTSMKVPFNSEDFYASWIGAGFGIGIAGGLNILIDEPDILKLLQEGWSIYRQYVDENKGIDNKIDTWNGIWLAHRLSSNFIKKAPRANFHPIKPGKNGVAVMERPSWTKILFALSNLYPNKTLNAYIYNFGQMNRTFGFVCFVLPEVKKISDFYNIIFGENKVLSNEKFCSIYESEFGLSTVCERFCQIGLRAFEPKDIKKYLPGKSNELPKYKDDEKTRINYSIYITWVVAMLNNKELLNLAEKAADSFREYEKGGKKGLVKRDNEIKELFTSRNRKELINRLTVLVEEEKGMAEICNALVKALMLDIAVDNVPLFVTLMKFQYTLPQKV